MNDEALYERYKDALRTGHVAAVRGRLETAELAYREAASLAPDRPLPHASLGGVLLRSGRVDEALVAFAEALRHGPRDELALAGRADALIEAGRPAEAAGVLDLLAEAQELAGRTADACDTARRALELAESRARRRNLEGLVGRLQASLAERGGEAELARALRTLETPAPIRAGSGGKPSFETPVTTADVPASPVVPATPPEPLADPAETNAAIERATATGDSVLVAGAVLEGVAAFRRAGLLDAAVDACLVGLTYAPADPNLHLALARLDIDHGWLAAAADKLVLIGRFVELTGDGAAQTRLCQLIAEQFPDDPRLAAICA